MVLSGDVAKETRVGLVSSVWVVVFRTSIVVQYSVWVGLDAWLCAFGGSTL